MIEEIYRSLYQMYNFEKREEQIDMSFFIDESMQSNIPIFVESETGSGKTIAYLIPTVLKALNENKNVVISTNTLNLQDQLLKKELPIIEKIFGEKIEYTLIKGRSNYVCKRKLKEFMDKNSNPELNKLVDEIFESKSGDRSEIKSSLLTSIWNDILSEKETSLYKKCPHFDTCFYYTKKRKNEKGRIFIVNHHILLLDRILKTESNTSLIPNFDILIIDEAHNLENVVRKYYSHVFSFKEIFKNLGLVYNRLAKSYEKSGLALRLISKLENSTSSLNIEYLRDLFSVNSDYIYDNLLDMMKTISNKIPNIKFNGNKMDILKDMDFNDKIKNIEFRLKELRESTNEIINFIENNPDVDKENENIFLNNVLSKIEEMFENLKINFEFDFENYIYWVKSDDGVYLTLNATPYSISNIFYENFIKKLENIILVSATLTTNNNFDYLSTTLGIIQNRSKIIKSSFNYKKQMNLLIPNNIPEPNEPDFKEIMVDFILKYTQEKNGQTFILCTSYSDLEYIHSYLKENSKYLNILKQGDYERVELLRLFKENSNSVLLGTDSFWEGVDIQGEALSNVIITKIPFQVPDDPIVESIAKKYGSRSFMEFQLPYAIIKLKQGVGRLIRSKNDKGNVIILDKRLYTKSYGKKVLKSLPDANVQILSLEDIVNYKV